MRSKLTGTEGMKPNDRISKQQEQLESLQEDVQQTGTCPACGAVLVVGTQVDIFNLIVFHNRGLT